jgi:purine-nucleoside phosphorylase
MSLYDQIQEAAQFIRSCWNSKPAAGIILGTGLGGLAEEIQAKTTISYADIPHFPRSTVQSHAGRFVCGQLGGKIVVAMEGRVHFYEGGTMQQLTFPVRVMKALGCGILIGSNAVGGMNPQFRKGDLMLIDDHINLMGDNPLIGPNDDRLGDRFPDMCHAYDRGLLDLARQTALDEKISAHTGVLVSVAGPNLETRAEYRFLRQIGADAVGMSLVPETIVAVHSKMRMLGISIITDMCLPDALEPVSLPEIIKVANQGEAKLRTLVRRVLEQLS